MAKNSIRDYDNTAGNNTDIQSVDISEGCSPAGINNAIREVMADLADVNDGTVALTSPSADSMTVTGDLTVDTSTLKVDSTNNRVGIGTTSPDATGLHVHTGSAGTLTPNSAADDLVVESNGNAGITIASPDANYSGIIFSSPTDTTGSIIEYNQSGATFDIGTATSGGVLRLRSGSFTEAMRITSSGQVGIGTSSPQASLDVTIPSVTSTETEILRLTDGVLCDFKVLLDRQSALNTSISVVNTAAGNMAFETSNTERMRIDSSGNVLVGTTSQIEGSKVCISAANGLGVNITGAGGGALNANYVSTGTGYFGYFKYNGTVVGSITSTGSSTAYNTSSDYRLKENVTGITDGIERVKQLNPSRFNFIADADTTVDGFLAHEAATVVPEAVTGEKDAMRDEEYEVTPAVLDDDGNVVTEAVMGTRSVPDYQGIDQAKLVPLLTAALQEAITKIEDLETRLTALEAE